MTTKTPTVHFHRIALNGYDVAACNGRMADRMSLTQDRKAVTCKRCAAKFPAIVRCPTCGKMVAHDALSFCCDDLTRCKGGCLEAHLEREAMHAGKVPEIA